jgi:hypothetical protein
MRTPDIFAFCCDLSEVECRLRLLRRRLDNFKSAGQMQLETVAVLDTALVRNLEAIAQMQDVFGKLPESEAFLAAYRKGQGFSS